MLARGLGVVGAMCFGFLAFLVFTSEPFDRIRPMPLDGRDLNPLLQDPGMIVHPPMLYIGYSGFMVPFAFAIAALLDGRVDARWTRSTRAWTNVARAGPARGSGRPAEWPRSWPRAASWRGGTGGGRSAI